MVKHMSSYWKRLGQHDKVFNYDESQIIKPSYRDLPFTQEYHIYEGQITPDTMIKDKESYEITELHPLFILNGFCIVVENGLVLYVTLFGIHPNKDPDNSKFCLPEYKCNVLFTEEYFDNLIRTFKIYYLDDAYFTPPLKYVTYRKLESMRIQLKKGDD